MTEPIWINVRDAMTLHDRLIALHGGATGIRDEALLQSALARPQQLYAYADSPDTIEMATAYTGGIVRNHPFVDGNKRTGFVVGILFEARVNIQEAIAMTLEANKKIKELNPPCPY